MPKSKRSKIVNLTKTKPKQREIKEKTLAKLDANFKKFNNIHILELHNLAGENQKMLTNELQGLIIFGKKTIMRLFFDRQIKNHPGLESFIEILVSPALKDVCLLLTNSPSASILETLKTLSCAEYAQPGTPATGTIVLSAGDQVFESISTSNDSYLRGMGLFTTVQNGKLFLQENYVASQKGKPVTVVQSKVLKMLGIKAGTFVVDCKAIYDKSLKIVQLNK